MEVESYMSMKMEEEQMEMELPPGFRFHPTDEELISHYLTPKVIDTNFTTLAIGEADLNKIEPWDLPSKAKMGEKEWYFFVVRDRKYPTGLRTNRATKAGYWKATGKDKEIYRAKALIGMKKTLVFYTGRAPKGQKTSWVMHEYRLEGNFNNFNNLPKNSKNDWAISRVFKKNSCAKKTEYIAPEFVKVEELHPSYFVPSLTDLSPPYNNTCDTKQVTDDIITPSSHVTCVSNPSSMMEENESYHLLQNQHQESSGIMVSNMVSEPCISDYQFDESVFAQDQSMLKLLFEGKSLDYSNSKMELPSFGLSNHGIVGNLDGVGPFDHDCLWDY